MAAIARVRQIDEGFGKIGAVLAINRFAEIRKGRFALVLNTGLLLLLPRNSGVGATSSRSGKTASLVVASNKRAQQFQIASAQASRQCWWSHAPVSSGASVSQRPNSEAFVLI
jgi:hypothetical protein